ncbi:MAG: PilZ domain-containing protein [Acidobacteria bacterium]|nr:PilZ domain-containing protein [Acidobacteriota bacterium]
MNDNDSLSENEISIEVIENRPYTPPAPPAKNSDDMPISVDNRRQYMARIPVEIDLHITTPEKKGIARSIDVSVNGLLVQTLLDLQWEERVIITILHPEEDTHACAKVARVAETNDPMGNKYGLSILSDDAAIWQGVLRRLIL